MILLKKLNEVMTHKHDWYFCNVFYYGKPQYRAVCKNCKMSAYFRNEMYVILAPVVINGIYDHYKNQHFDTRCMGCETFKSINDGIAYDFKLYNPSHNWKFRIGFDNVLDAKCKVCGIEHNVHGKPYYMQSLRIRPCNEVIMDLALA